MNRKMIILTVVIVTAANLAFADGSPELFHKLKLGMTEKQVSRVLKREPEACIPRGNGTVMCAFTGGVIADGSTDTVACVFSVATDKLVAAMDGDTMETIGDEDLLNGH